MFNHLLNALSACLTSQEVSVPMEKATATCPKDRVHNTSKQTNNCTMEKIKRAPTSNVDPPQPSCMLVLCCITGTQNTAHGAVPTEVHCCGNVK